MAGRSSLSRMRSRKANAQTRSAATGQFATRSGGSAASTRAASTTMRVAGTPATIEARDRLAAELAEQRAAQEADDGTADGTAAP